jgi:16S rRNA (uracil1498-N3)-methyltransferase
LHLFYQPDLSGETILLSEEESKHAVRVLRLSIGDKVELVDGKGTRADAEVSDDHAKRCVLKINSRSEETTNRNYHVHIAVAPTKNIERIEWFIEKATEIGIDEITLLDCEHSERSVVKTERLEKVAISAMKQSQQSWLPVINDMVSYNVFVKSAKADVKLIAHCEEGVKNPISKIAFSGKNILALIGPEGDFSRAEIETALGNQFTAVSLGETRLRTETAALYAVVAINSATANQ